MITLEPMRWWDIEQVAAMERDLFAGDSPWPAEAFWGELAVGNHYVVHRTRAGRVLGYAGLGLTGDDAQVLTIAVAADQQGGGIGRTLLDDLIRSADGRRILLEVRTDNAPAIGLYLSAGFEHVGLRRRYYQPSGADAFTMARPTGLTGPVGRPGPAGPASAALGSRSSSAAEASR